MPGIPRRGRLNLDHEFIDALRNTKAPIVRA
jgi:hypothetical protein